MTAALAVTDDALRTWILDSDEPWSHHRLLVVAEGRAPSDPEVVAARGAMTEHRAIRELVERAATWPGHPLKRHNDASHPLYAIATLADFGLDRRDDGVAALAEQVFEHFDGEAFETRLWLPRFLTKQPDAERWSWMMCDAPTLLYALLRFGYGDRPDVQAAVSALVARVADNGWRCGAAASLPRFSGPGRKADTCPMATTYALKALSAVQDAPAEAVESGVEALLGHWRDQQDHKLKMFGIGTDFRKVKYPFVWYDLLHVTEVLSRFEVARSDPRLGEMVQALVDQADADGRTVASSMYTAWKGWSFADKKRPSPWLTAVVLGIRARMAC